MVVAGVVDRRYLSHFFFRGSEKYVSTLGTDTATLPRLLHTKERNMYSFILTICETCT